jgi:hypothetical protein
MTPTLPAHAWALLLLTGAASGCADQREAPAKPDLPFYVGGGAGSQFGNYAASVAGEMIDKSGRRCVVFNWDRPLSQDSVLRLRSASCEISKEPGPMLPIDLGREIIPMSASYLSAQEREPGL